MGNVYNWGDVTMSDSPAIRQRGLVYLYFSNQNPSEVIPIQSPPSMKIPLDVLNSSKPLFEALGRKYAEVTNNSELQYIKLNYHAHFFQHKDYVIFVHDVIWTLLGSYDVVTSADGDDDITWHAENNKPVLHVLFVCLNLFPTEFIKSNRTIEHFFFDKHPI
jgi:hypothetical protein